MISREMVEHRSKAKAENGVDLYIGIAPEKLPKRILILGESHHDIPPTMTTQQVVDGYLEGKHVQFFQNIAKSFGIESRRNDFQGDGRTP